jgi:hypothetical protein
MVKVMLIFVKKATDFLRVWFRKTRTKAQRKEIREKRNEKRE